MPPQLQSFFVEGQLRYVRREIINYPLPEYLMADGRIVPISNEIPIGATSYTYYNRTMVGEAVIISNPADDLPTADVFTNPQTGIIYNVGDSYRYSDMDLEAAQFSGQNLTLAKAIAAKQAMLVKLDKIGYIGDPKYNLMGLVNQVNIPSASVLPDGVGGSTKWVDKTPTQVLRDLRDMASLIPVETSMVEQPDVILIPPLHHYYLMQTYKDPASDMTLLEAALRPQGEAGIRFIQPAPYLAGAAPDGSDMAIVFKRREDKAKFHIPMPFTPKTPQEHNLHYRVPCRATTGGVEMTTPTSARYFYGI